MSMTARRRSGADTGGNLVSMTSTPLRPPSPRGVGAAAHPSAEPLAWPGLFDAPDTVDRVWTDFVAALPDPAHRTALRRALAFARARHEGQYRRGSETPYWVHLVRVAMELSQWGVRRPELLQAALLHDTVEDTVTTIDEIRVGFGEEVADLVDWLTAPRREDDLREYYERFQASAPFDAQLLMLTGDRYRRWAGHYLRRTVWQVLPLAAGAPSVARVALVTAMADLAPLVDEGGFTNP